MDKFRNAILAMSMICLGLPMFTSCEEDEKEWELTELELAPTESFDIQYKGGSQSFSFKTNTNWKILSSGDWISFDKTSGTGDATVIATFAENSSNDNRKAVIRIISGEEPTPNNYVGVKEEKISTLQHSYYQNRIDAISIRVKDAICDKRTEYSQYSKQFIYDVKASLEVETNDKNTSELILQIGAELCYKLYLYDSWDNRGYYYDRSSIFKFEFENNYNIEWTENGYTNDKGKIYCDYSSFSLKPFAIFKNPDGSQRAKVYYDEVPVTINIKD